MEIEVIPVPALSDNYIWMFRDPVSGSVAVVDPGQDAPALAAAEQRGWAITHSLNTHWHPDHTGGNAGIKAATGAPVIAPAEAKKVSAVDRVIAEGDRVTVGDLEAEVWDIPAHTAGHVALYFKAAKMIFTGDTLFAMGCGRLFEGTAEQMFANMQRFAALPDDVLIYCGHEYSLANARFAAHVEPDNAAVTSRLKKMAEMRDRGEVTLPTSIGEEKATNPFMRARDADELARLRTMKDSFG
ncbi:hydroxyacylglutathione hydrolase [Sphingomonas sp.]|uniref:hydroxyacylglutathione hydrolase n=1 Tax=Sphingomonas sp. TaxID=28214 RepID=UPI00286D360A|nr:hydroxyacylglutathione hydrolase [Sphingomonas sp.]